MKSLLSILLSLVATSVALAANAALPTVPVPVPVTPIPSLLSGTLSVDTVTDYTFRGTKLEGASLQPTLNVQIGSVYANVWANQSLRRSSSREVDVTVGGSLPLGFDTGLTAYTYAGPTITTWEPYLGWALELGKAAKVSAYGYYDVTLHVGTVEGKVAIKGFTFNGVDLSSELTLGRVLKGSSALSPYTYWGAGPVVRLPLGESLSLSTSVQYISSSEVTVKRDLWVGKAGVSFSF